MPRARNSYARVGCRRSWGSLRDRGAVSVAPVVRLYERLEVKSSGPTDLLEHRARVKGGYIPQAQYRDRTTAFRHAQQHSQRLRVKQRHLTHPDILSARGQPEVLNRASDRCQIHRRWRWAQTTGCPVCAGITRRCGGVSRETTSCRFIASRMAAMSDSTAPSSQAAYIENIVVGRCPCCFATSNGLRPIAAAGPVGVYEGHGSEETHRRSGTCPRRSAL